MKRALAVTEDRAFFEYDHSTFPGDPDDDAPIDCVKYGAKVADTDQMDVDGACADGVRKSSSRKAAGAYRPSYSNVAAAPIAVFGGQGLRRVATERGFRSWQAQKGGLCPLGRVIGFEAGIPQF